MTRTDGADTLDRFMRAPWPIRVSTVVAMCFCLVHQARAQPAVAPVQGPVLEVELTAETVEFAKNALEQARKARSSAAAVETGTGTVGQSVGRAAGSAWLTSEFVLAGVSLVQAAGLVGAFTGLTHLYTVRSGSIVRYGTPYGAPALDIAFPLRRVLRERRAALPRPFPVPEPGPDDDLEDEPRPGRVYATYTRYNRATGRYYAGRTSAVIDLRKDWDAQARAVVRARHGDRDPGQEPDPTGSDFEDAVLDQYMVGLAVDYAERYRDLAYLVIRGREQQLIDFRGAQRARERGIEEFRGGAQSDTKPGEALTENKIRGVARDNPLGELFHEAANLRFGQLAPYTGKTRL